MFLQKWNETDVSYEILYWQQQWGGKLQPNKEVKHLKSVVHLSPSNLAHLEGIH
jgi:hypothetical protein